MNRAVARAAILLSLGVAACTSASRPANDAALPAPVGSARTTSAINEADLRQRLYAVADDSMGGRPTGSAGHIKVTDHIAAEMKRLGLQPGGEYGTYFQSVPFVRRNLTTSDVTVDGEALTVWQDFAPVHPGGTALRSFDGVPVVFGGIAQDTTTMLTREQAAGKLVILINRSQGPFLRGANPGTRLEGAAAVATIQSPNAMNIYRNFLRNPNPVYQGNAPVAGERGVPMGVTPEAAARLFGAPVDSTLAVGTTGKIVRGSIAWTEAPVVARNVIAILPGSNPQLKGQYVAIGSHSDHDPLMPFAVDHDSLRVFNTIMRAKRLEVGGRQLSQAERAEIKVNVDSLRQLRPARPDSIKNGADDDGSGTVAMLEIAEAMAAMKQKPARSTLFIWHVAEELGLIGANHFTRNPTVERDSIVAALNIDMIGRGGPGEELEGGPNYIQLIGWRRLSNQLGDIVDAANNALASPFKFDLQYDAPGHPEQYYCRSDHYMYARYGIPVAFFSTGSHGDYHQVTDEPQYIDYAKLRKVTQLIHDVALRVANLDHRPVVDGEKSSDPNAPCKQ